MKNVTFGEAVLRLEKEYVDSLRDQSIDKPLTNAAFQLLQWLNTYEPKRVPDKLMEDNA